MLGEWNHKIFQVQPVGFEQLALEVFMFQYHNNPVYYDYCNAIEKNPANVSSAREIPFLPISFFKSHQVKTTEFDPPAVFESSGTTTTVNSRHYVRDMALYKESFTKTFEIFYGPVADWCIIGLLPSYLERNNSSLVYMVDALIKKTNHPQSGFYLHELDRLAATLLQAEEAKQKTLLIGVTFALLDFASSFPMPLSYTTMLETGGMKGRRQEMIRPEVHSILQNAFQLPVIHSEYGMTELLSQAYSKGNGIFSCPPWMKIFVRDEEDPFMINESGRGVINVIDLANIYSCSFIATDDAGLLNTNGTFEVIGRVDNSDVRGCSLMTV
jgi:hypothetical protein